MSEEFRNERLRVVPPQPLDAIVFLQPIEIDQEPVNLLCGGCAGDTVLVRGLSLGTVVDYFRDKRGSFLVCHKCSAYNELSGRSIP